MLHEDIRELESLNSVKTHIASLISIADECKDHPLYGVCVESLILDCSVEYNPSTESLSDWAKSISDKIAFLSKKIGKAFKGFYNEITNEIKTTSSRTAQLRSVLTSVGDYKIVAKIPFKLKKPLYRNGTLIKDHIKAMKDVNDIIYTLGSIIYDDLYDAIQSAKENKLKAVRIPSVVKRITSIEYPGNIVYTIPTIVHKSKQDDDYYKELESYFLFSKDVGKTFTEVDAIDSLSYQTSIKLINSIDKINVFDKNKYNSLLELFDGISDLTPQLHSLMMATIHYSEVYTRVMKDVQDYLRAVLWLIEESIYVNTEHL